jgi:hypothetical protein
MCRVYVFGLLKTGIYENVLSKVKLLIYLNQYFKTDLVYLKRYLFSRNVFHVVGYLPQQY